MNHNLSSVKILDVRVDRVTMQDTLNFVSSSISNGSYHQIVTVNPEFVMKARKNILFRNILNEAELSLPDGIGIVLASKLLGKQIPERVTGVDTVERISALARDNGWRIFFLGAADGVAEQAADILRSKYPGIQIVGTYAGSPRIEEEEGICSRIIDTKPHILFVAYGAPSQDIWIARNLNKIKVPVAIGIGGTFDFIAGISSRAPVWIQRLGVEWLYRLFREPWRWKRMLALPHFAALVIYSRIFKHTQN
ncbi:MAG: acetylglucosaminyldiphospho-UDP acetyl-beta-D-mannosaminyltransferase [Chlorobiaceae bacterium]|nr:acetylglucosaminyldiphospho-UDP acetyl-beta-D-mannosaminyltransferase [Chlorobiaceae bacterium]